MLSSQARQKIGFQRVLKGSNTPNFKSCKPLTGFELWCIISGISDSVASVLPYLSYNSSSSSLRGDNPIFLLYHQIIHRQDAENSIKSLVLTVFIVKNFKSISLHLDGKWMVNGNYRIIGGYFQAVISIAVPLVGRIRDSILLFFLSQSLTVRPVILLVTLHYLHTFKTFKVYQESIIPPIIPPHTRMSKKIFAIYRLLWYCIIQKKGDDVIRREILNYVFIQIRLCKPRLERTPRKEKKTL